MMSQKREKAVNFTKEEMEYLVQLVEENMHIIENKQSDVSVWNQKERCWKNIEILFNGFSGNFRSAKTLKLKYEGLKRDTRRKSTSDLTPIEKKVKSLILSPVEGTESTLDSDNMLESAEGEDPHTPNMISADNESSQWKPKVLRSKKHTAWRQIYNSNRSPKSHLKKLAETKQEIANIQRQMIIEEFENKRKQWAFEEEEREHKRQMWALEKRAYK